MESKVKALAGAAVPLPAAGAGVCGWNHPDTLELDNPGLTDTESRSRSSLWMLLNAPLLAGNDIRNMSETTRSIRTNATSSP